MKTMYYLENETRQKLKDFHKEKAYQRLQETATESHSSTGLFRWIRTGFTRLASLLQRIVRLGHYQREQSINLERSLDEA